MALTQIDICNQALLKVGQDLISSLDTETAPDEGSLRSAKLCNVLYSQAVEEVLRMYPWNSCTKRVLPTKLSTSPAFGYDNAFQLPNDFLRMLHLFDSTKQYDDQMKWVIEGDQILCDYDTIYIIYTFLPENIGIVDPLCSSAIITNLAIKLATPLQLEQQWASTLTRELYEVIMPQARSIDTIENKELMLEESYWITGRDFNTPII